MIREAASARRRRDLPRRGTEVLFLALALTGLVTGCVPSPDARLEGNKSIVRGYMEEILNDGEWEQWDHYFPETVVFNEAETSLQAVMGMMSMLRAAFPDLYLTIEDQLAEGALVATRVTFRGTHLGEFNGIAPTGRQVRYRGIAIDRIADGKVVEMWHEADSAAMLRQLVEE